MILSEGFQIRKSIDYRSKSPIFFSGNKQAERGFIHNSKDIILPIVKFEGEILTISTPASSSTPKPTKIKQGNLIKAKENSKQLPKVNILDSFESITDKEKSPIRFKWKSSSQGRKWTQTPSSKCRTNQKNRAANKNINDLFKLCTFSHKKILKCLQSSPRYIRRKKLDSEKMIFSSLNYTPPKKLSIINYYSLD